MAKGSKNGKAPRKPDVLFRRSIGYHLNMLAGSTTLTAKEACLGEASTLVKERGGVVKSTSLGTVLIWPEFELVSGLWRVVLVTSAATLNDVAVIGFSVGGRGQEPGVMFYQPPSRFGARNRESLNDYKRKLSIQFLHLLLTTQILKSNLKRKLEAAEENLLRVVNGT